MAAVNRVINFWNDGAESNVYSLNSSYNTDRFGIRGKGKISDDWSSGFVIEIEDTGNQSRFVNQFNDNTDNGLLRVRKSAISLESKTYGRVWLGLQEMAKDNINKDTIVIKGLDQTMHADFYMNWSFFLRQKGFNNAEAFSSFHAAFPGYRPLLLDQQLGLRLFDPPQRGSLRHARMVGLHRQRVLGRGRYLVRILALPEGMGQLEDRRGLRL